LPVKTGKCIFLHINHLAWGEARFELSTVNPYELTFSLPQIISMVESVI
jgi:hypothetical protein